MRLLKLVPLLGLFCATPARAATPVLAAGDASITHDTEAGTWTLTAGGTTLTLAIDASHDFQVLRLATSSQELFTVGTQSDSLVTINGTPAAFGSRVAGFVYQKCDHRSRGHRHRPPARRHL
jgi:hypothetical protein